ncbi:neural cell adhesion molecule 2 isoform X2 [Parasteatoda tepidariorum]|uniref:neural cell adhesion molecule 2 isoform X2 n=1 Tax=Parasteatoda tepidariorum TaxID=114398 RepID=UPI000A2C0CCF|nr:nephrin isoform X2 [Parasteatoda tepidariorum]XP_042897576.1 nephrin isoform X2 [Parasteatoda tepidariorum]
MNGLQLCWDFKLWIIFAQVLWMYLFNFKPVIATVHEFYAVAGNRISMPCNITAPSSDDVVTLVLWYKGDMKVPIYTLDARKGPIEKSKHFPSSKLGRRVHFDLHVKNPGLAIDPVKGEDAGTYRCRVEYKRYRTLSYQYELKVIVPPREVNIMDDRGQRIEETIGPVDEGSNVTLICEAEGGSPSPSVTWWRDSVLLDDTYHITTQGYVRNDVILIRLKRSDLSAIFTCQAANNNLTVPTSYSVTLDLNLRPLDVRIITLQPHLSAGKKVTLECESTGSRPRAVMTWWKGSQKIQTGNEVISDNGNLTLSTLSFVPTAEDHGKKFTCTAENPSLPNSLIEDTRTITVHYIPELRLALGASIQHTAIKEGSDVYFDCNIRANPWVHDVSWRFEDNLLFSNLTGGIIVSNQSLVLQRVKKEHRGRYQCVATNSEGEGRSEEVPLDVQFVPVCKNPAVQIFGVAKQETLNITCELDGDPKEIEFHWALNNTVESMEVKKFISDGLTSTVYYTPRNMLGYGALLCWGINNIGRQRDPCVYRVVPVGPPETMRNCLVTNHTTDSLLIQCEPGYDGGLPQTFHLEVYSSTNEHLQGNMTSEDSPSFLVQDLLTGTSFILVLYAANAKGRSNSVALYASTLRPAERHTAQEDDLVLSPIIGILIGIVSAFAILFIVIAVIIKRRTREKRKDSEDSKQEKCEIPIQNYKEESIDSTIESPDVIPADSQVYTPDAKSIHLECTRRMNEEMYKLLKQKQDNYDSLIPMNDQSRSEVVEDISYTDIGVRAYHKRSVPLHMEPPTEYADVYRHGVRTQVLPLPVSDALDKHAPELPLINNMQQNTRVHIVYL